jgi:5,10-methylenetetrahydrofolate reductase
VHRHGPVTLSMHRSLHEALAQRPLFFEPVPPTVRANPVRSGLALEDMTRLLKDIPRLDAVDVPELVDENHDGRPYYRTGDVRPFAHLLGEQLGRASIVNKVVAHLASPAALADWARESVGLEVTNVVLVGGSSRYIPYPGPPVLEANRICHEVLAPHHGLLGNIAIPQRTGEAHRMVAKARAGAAFFTTQILFDTESIAALIREYGRRSAEAGVPPSPIVLSFAPIADEADAEFVRWLGSDIPEAAERHILNDDDEGSAASRSVKNAVGVFAWLLRTGVEEGWTVPLGVNVEQISQRHLMSAVEMLRAFAARIDEGPPATPAAPRGDGTRDSSGGGSSART